jgi:hypothetical protein
LRLFSFIDVPRRPLRGRGTRARALARGSACATNPCGVSGVSGTALSLFFALSMFSFSGTRMRMADVFCQQRKKSRPFAFCPHILRQLPVPAGSSEKEGPMLKACQKGDYRRFIPFSVDEDRAMRRAFGRFASAEARAAGADVVQRFQHKGPGCWIACDCLDGLEERPPVLIPVLESFVRRHTDPPWPEHAELCDFFRKPAEQKAISRSYGPPSPGPLRLVRRYGQVEEDALEREVSRSYAWRREGLATMLRLLQIKSGLFRFTGPSSRPKLGDQYRLLRKAAAEIEIDDNLPLSRFLCTYALPCQIS